MRWSKERNISTPSVPVDCSSHPFHPGARLDVPRPLFFGLSEDVSPSLIVTRSVSGMRISSAVKAFIRAKIRHIFMPI